MTTKLTSKSPKANTQSPDSPIETSIIKLPTPKSGQSKSVFSSLKARRTCREILPKEIPLQMLSNLLWAACGINRKKGPFGMPGRTAGSASNSQEIDIYVAMPEATYLYEAISHSLIFVANGDLRAVAIGQGQGSAGAQAPVRFIYVVDLDKFNNAGYPEPGLYDPEIQKSYYFVDTGLIAGNVYLAASSQGLATWFHNCNRVVLAKKLKLRKDQRALFGQTIGY